MKLLHFRQALAALLARALSALLWFLLMSTGGVALVVAGVYLLVGLGWAFVAAGFFLLLGAALISRGMGNV